LYCSKHPDSCLRFSVPKTFYFDLSFPDELDELLQDDLYEVALAFEEDEARGDGQEKWWILKAALADKGNGIRLFSNRETLDAIFEEFEDDSDDDEEVEGESESTAGAYGLDTRVNASQLREWVIQVRRSLLLISRRSWPALSKEYISSPLLVDPTPGCNSTGHKFHLRVYVLAVGGLTVYVHHPFLALFAPTAYESPSTSSSGNVDLSSHLTNTCLQTSILGDATPDVAVSTLPAMADRIVLGGPSQGEIVGEKRIRDIEESVGKVVCDTFKAAVGAGTSFQVSLLSSHDAPTLISSLRRPYPTLSKSLASISSSTIPFKSFSSRSTLWVTPSALRHVLGPLSDSFSLPRCRAPILLKQGRTYKG
jgi:tubulin--tyrosine ligase